MKRATINIYNAQEELVATIGINEGAKAKFLVGSEDSITLPFVSASPIAFAIGDHCDLREIYETSDGLASRFAKIYTITEKPAPTYEASTGAYRYELRFEAYYFAWRNKILKYIPQHGAKETAWTLTAPIDTHLEVVRRCLADLGYTYNTSGTPQPYTLTADKSKIKDTAKSLQYNNTNIIDALTQIAEAWECEWWVVGNIIYFGKDESATPVALSMATNVTEMSKSDSAGTFATRLYFFGAERNLPENYRETTSDATINGIVQKRLMLPTDKTKGKQYVDAYRYKANGATLEKVFIGSADYDTATIEMDESEAVEAVVVKDDIYPKVTATIGAGMIGSYTKPVTNQDGTAATDPTTGEPLTETFYYFGAQDFRFNKAWILEGATLEVVFTKGKLNGMTFAVSFNPKGSVAGGQQINYDFYEIVANEDYGRKLPDTILKPAEGDTFVLQGWDATKITETDLIKNAEQSLYTEAVKYIKKTMVDDGTYTAIMASHWINADSTARAYDLGQKVTLENAAFFETPRISRVIGYEINLDIPSDGQIYTIGESAQYSRLGELEGKLDEITLNGQTYQGTTNSSGTSVYLIRANDDTQPTDLNAYSALRSQQEHLSKKRDDRTEGELSAKGFKTNNFRASGDIIGAGGGIYTDAEGKTYIEGDYIVARLKAIFAELQINKISYTSGDMIVGHAGNKVTRVQGYTGTPESPTICQQLAAATFYRCYIFIEDGTTKVTNDWVAGDLARCQTFNIEAGTTANAANTFYWRQVINVGADYIDLSASDCAESSGYPQAGDEIVQMGHKPINPDMENRKRQSGIMLSVNGSDAPSFKLYRGLNTYNLTPQMLPVNISADGVHIEGDFVATSMKMLGHPNLLQDATFMQGLEIPDTRTIEQPADTLVARVEAKPLRHNGLVGLCLQTKVTATKSATITWQHIDLSKCAEGFSAQFWAHLTTGQGSRKGYCTIYKNTSAGRKAIVSYNFTRDIGAEWQKRTIAPITATADMNDCDLEFALDPGTADTLYISEPILAEGDVSAYPWNNGETDVQKSMIATTEQGIDLAVLRNGIERAGVHIDGEKSEVRAVAEHFKVQDTSGNTTIEVDSEGNLDAKGGGYFKGKVVSGTANGQRVEMDAENKSISIFNANSELKTLLDGNTRTLADIKPGGTASFTLLAQQNKAYLIDDPQPTPIVLAYTTRVSPKAANDIQVAGTANLSTYSATATATAYFVVYAEATFKTKRAEIEITRAICGDGTATNKYATLEFDKAITAPAGYYRLEIILKNNFSHFQEGGESVRITTQAKRAQFLEKKFISRFFANGMAQTIDADNYFIPIEENGVINCYIKSNGITYQIINGALFSQGVAQPRLIYRATWWNGTASFKVYDAATTSGGVVTLTLTKKAIGKFLFKMSGHGYTADHENTIVRVSYLRGYSPEDDLSTYSTPINVDFAGIDKGTQAFLVMLTNQSGGFTDGNVAIEIWRKDKDASVPTAASLDEPEAQAEQLTE